MRPHIMSSHSFRLTSLICWTSAALLLACSGGSGGKQGNSSHPGADPAEAPRCISSTPEPPKLPELQARELPLSEVWIDSRLATADLLKQVRNELPQPLAQAKKQPVGAPGRATYKVTHRAPQLKNTKQGLELRIPIQADISVCKPLGRSCFRYGSCHPAFEARVSIADRWDKQYRLRPPRARIVATKKCVIGMDVTPQIEKIARGETAKVERQLAQRWPRTEIYARAAWSELSRPIPVSKESCVHLVPRSVRYSPLRVQKKGKTEFLVGGLGLSGVLTPTEDCQTTQRLPSLPPTQIETGSHGPSRLWIPQALSFEEIEEGLKNGLQGTWGEEPDNDLRVTKVLFGSQQVAIQVQSKGEVCGPIWIWGRLLYEKAGHQLVLEIDGHTDTATSESIAAPLMHHLRMNARFRVTSHAPFNRAQAEKAIVHLTDSLPPEVKLSVSKLEVPKSEVLLNREGPLLLHTLTALLEVKALKLRP